MSNVQRRIIEPVTVSKFDILQNQVNSIKNENERTKKKLKRRNWVKK